MSDGSNMLRHSLKHALNGPCFCEPKHIWFCVICGSQLPAFRSHVDTCKEACFNALLQMQRERDKP